jgi:hypothetical protein
VRCWQNEGGSDTRVEGHKLQDLGRLGLTSEAIRGGEAQREAGPEVAGSVCQLIGWRGTGGELGEVAADRLGVRGGRSTLRCPAAARRKTLTSGAETRGGWHQLTGRGASRSRSGAQGGGEGADQWLEAAGNVEVPATEETDGVNGFGSCRPTT